MNLIIASDLVPTKSNITLFNDGNVMKLFGEEILSVWNSANIRIFNLEVPLINKEYPIKKCGPNLVAPVSTINGIKALNPSLITIANNHILDQGEQGLKSTIDILNKNNIPFIGAGDNLHEAGKAYIIQEGGVKVGVYACAEHEFTIATEKTSGSNPFDPLESFDHIQALKLECNHVIVLYHGGKEHYRYPSPYLQKVCRKMVSKGADVVICQHSHCVGCFEEYEESTIVYGQGNFLFDDCDDEFWNTSLLVKINIKSGLKIDYVPIAKRENAVRLATGDLAEEILSKFGKRSNEILEDGFIHRQYENFALENVQPYLRSFSGVGKWLSRIDRKLLNGLLLKNKYNENNLLQIKNFVECEAHRELVLEGISIISKKESDE